MDLTLNKLLTLFWKNILLIVVCVIVFASAAFFYTEYFVQPQYSASVKFFIDASSDDTADINKINYAQKVIHTYVEILKTTEFRDKVGHETNYIPSRFAFSTAGNDVEIIKATVYANSKKEADTVIDAVKKIAPQHIHDIIGNSINGIIPFDPTYSAGAPVSPDKGVNVLIGFFGGLLVSCAYIILKEMFDTRIKSNEELTNVFNIPILGTVPDFSVKMNAKKGVRKHE